MMFLIYNSETLMPTKPANSLPDVIFVSDERSGALFHHSKTDDIVDLLLEHVKIRALFEDPTESVCEDSSNWIYQFGMRQIDCESNLKFTKRSFIYHPQLLMDFLQINSLPDTPVSEMLSEIPVILQTLRSSLRIEMESHLQKIFKPT